MTQSEQYLASRASADQAVASASSRAQADMQDDALARSKGAAPGQQEARQRVAALFCQIHFPQRDCASLLAGIDYAQPVVTLNARGIDVQNPRAKGFLGLGRKPAYLVSERWPPQAPEDPLYALEYLPLQS